MIMAEDVVLVSLLKLSGKPVDVTLSSRCISWTAGALSTTFRAARPRRGNVYQHVKLSEVIKVATDEAVTESSSSDKLGNNETFSFTVHYVKRNTQQQWRVHWVKFECEERDVCLNWEKNIRARLTTQGNIRPKKLLVFVNPFGGEKKAVSIYNTKAQPLFELVNITTTVIYTTTKNHAYDTIMETDLSLYDGIVCVGGDGTFAEVSNGLLVRTQQENDVDRLDTEATPVSPQLRIGIIPAGSTDVVVHDSTGVRDPVTSVLQIILGYSVGLDVCSVYSDDEFLMYAISFMGYGFFGDVLQKSENYRWLGQRRYDFAGFLKYFGNKSYLSEVSFLTSDDEDNHPRDEKRCRVGCTVCLRRTTSQMSDVQDCLPDSLEKTEPEDTISVTGQNGTWTKLSGSLLSITASLTCGYNRLAPTGMAPYCHLGNGCLDLFIVHKCSRFNFLRLLQRLASRGNHLDFDFVEIHRVKEFKLKSLPRRPAKSHDKKKQQQQQQPQQTQQQPQQFQSECRANTSNDISCWNIDGEVETNTDIVVRVHCQLIKIFAQGREDSNYAGVSCCAADKQLVKKTNLWR